MAKNLHTGISADTAAKESHTQQGLFRDAPEIFLRPVLVHQHKQKADCIEYKEIRDKQFHKLFLSGGILLKKWVWIALAALLLTGCGTEETFETVTDEWVQPVAAEIREVYVALPPEAVSPVLEGDGNRMYICGDYEIYQQTLNAGDLGATVQSVSGYELDDITIVETMQGDCKRYDLVWASAGEVGDRVGKARILDDGNYHYVLSVLGDADTAGEYKLVWQDMFASFSLI